MGSRAGTGGSCAETRTEVGTHRLQLEEVFLEQLVTGRRMRSPPLVSQQGVEPIIAAKLHPGLKTCRAH